MPSAVYQTKLTADTTQHDQALGRSAKQVYNYKKGCDEADKGVNKMLGGFKKFVGVAGLATIAMKTFKGVLNSSTSATDNYGSIMQSANRITEEFQRSIATMDFTNLYNGLGDLITRANEYYNALDNLQTLQTSLIGDNARLNAQLEDARRRYKAGDESAADEIRAIGKEMAANVKAEQEALKKELDEYVKLKTSVTVGIHDPDSFMGMGRKGSIGKTAGDFRSMDDIQYLLRNQDALTSAISQAERRWKDYERQLKANGDKIYGHWVTAAQYEAEYKSLKALQEAMADDEGLKHFEENYAKYYSISGDYERIMTRVDTLLRKDPSTGPKSGRTVTVEPVIPAGSIAALEKQLQDLKHQYSLAITDEGEGGRNELKKKIEDAEEELKRLKGEIQDLPVGSLAQWEKDLKDLRLAWSLATTDTDRAKIKEAMDTIQAEIDRINGVTIETKLKIDDGSVADLQDKIANKKKEMEASGDLDFIIKCKLEIEGWEADIKRITEATKTPTEQVTEDINKMVEGYKNAGEEAQAWGNAVGEAFNFIAECSDDETAKVLKGFATISSQVASMLPQVFALVAANEAKAMAAGVAGAAEVPYPGSIGAIASIVAELLAIFGTIASISKFADGGIVGGSSRIGDMNIARVNAGEMILNGRQQAKLFQLLNNGTSLGSSPQIEGNVRFEIEGSKLVGVLGNYERKIGRVRP